MSFWKKSNYKPKENYWFDDPNYLAEQKAKGWGGWGGTYNAAPTTSYYSGYVYKPKYDMGSSLETRVTNLIRAITGKTVKLVQANGWGSDAGHFFYKASDLENATDDEVLGRILQQLSKDLFQEPDLMRELQANEPKYKELVDALEANRSDKQLSLSYYGTKYYASELWEVRKIIDNPTQKNNKQENDKAFANWIKDNGYDAPGGKSGYLPLKGHEKIYRSKFNSEFGIQEEMAPNPSWEFCFNIHAFQNDEKEFDFTDDKVAENFSKALPFINDYLNASTFEAALTSYHEIKKFYPIPTDEQQEQMKQGMGQTQGLSESEKAQATKQAKEQARRDARAEGEQDGEAFMRDFSRDPDGDFKVENERRNMVTYNRYLAEYQGTANVLYMLIRSILKDNAIKRYARPFKRGKLDAKRMYKYLATDNLRIFKRQREVSKKDYLMTIVIDMSGSMRGYNSTYACQGAIVMCDVLDKLGFPYEVLAYNDDVYTVKKFSEPLKKEWLPVIELATGNNNEVATIKAITKHISAYDSTNKYKKSIFWITDGQSNDPDEVKKRTTELEKKHNATVYAIGIGNMDEKYLKESYNTTLAVNKVEELPKELVNLMKSQFKRV